MEKTKWEASSFGRPPVIFGTVEVEGGCGTKEEWKATKARAAEVASRLFGGVVAVRWIRDENAEAR